MEGIAHTLPAVFPDQAPPALDAITVDGVAGIDEVEEHVVKKALKGGNRGSNIGEEVGEGVCSRDTEG